jgi:anti-anti-sigma factor
MRDLPLTAIPTMPIDFEDSNNDLRYIRLSGRLDILGTGEVETKFAALAATSKYRLVVDLSGVSFLASIGIRAIITNAKAQQQRGGRMVLFVGDNATVAKTIEATGIDTLVPMFSNLVDAEQAAAA